MDPDLKACFTNVEKQETTLEMASLSLINNSVVTLEILEANRLIFCPDGTIVTIEALY